jgi:transposase
MVGGEGTGSWGVGLSRFFHDDEISVVEVDRPNRQNRQNRRKIGKSDTTDAISAARAALSGSAWVTPKTRSGPVEQIRILLVARRSARSQSIETLNQLRHLIFTAPDTVRSRFQRGRPKTGLVTEVAKLRPRKGSDPVLCTTQVTMRGHALRVQSFNAEIKSLDTVLTELVHDTAPSVVGLYGVGPDTAATLLVAAGDNPDPKCCNDPLNSHRLRAGGPTHRRTEHRNTRHRYQSGTYALFLGRQIAACALGNDRVRMGQQRRSASMAARAYHRTEAAG